ncbi:MAG: tetratricopeptide repeat protein [Anaerolineales bacterium]|nr:tetratricopeptide repeat protein [Anaerolineales bacterium]
MGVTGNRITRNLNGRWFALVDLLCVSISAGLWYGQPGIGAWPLLIALLPWFIRLIAGRFPFHRTPFDLALVIFVATAAVGVWAAYDREVASTKFWVIVGAILFYYALVGQPRDNFWILASLLSLIGLSITGFFMLTHDWEVLPAKVGALNRLGLWWMSVRPVIYSGKEILIHPNDAAGMMAITTPFLIGLGIRAWRERRLIILFLLAVIYGVVSVSLLITTSRGAWIALAVGVGIWLLWIVSGIMSRGAYRWRRILFSSAVIGVMGSLVLLALLSPGGVYELLDSLPGPQSAGSRMELSGDTMDLITDFPFTGGGLGAFPGLYSNYVLVIPFPFLYDGHNFFLDVTLEQGLLGLLTVVIIMLGSGWMLVRPRRLGTVSDYDTFFCWSILTSLTVAMIHGLVTDTLYGNRGTPIFFLFAGLTIAVAQPDRVQGVGQDLLSEGALTNTKPKGIRFMRVIVVVVGIGLLATIYGLRDQLLANWYANLGAVQMAQVELAAWPTGKWNDGRNVTALSPAEDLFNRALQLDPTNRTAHHRLGLIAMLRRDFTSAVSHLERASEQDPGHRGIQKSLGYSYVWSGHLERAADLLRDIPEARDEMQVYRWWWGTQGREDLTAYAAQMVERLQSSYES